MEEEEEKEKDEEEEKRRGEMMMRMRLQPDCGCGGGSRERRNRFLERVSRGASSVHQAPPQVLEYSNGKRSKSSYLYPVLRSLHLLWFRY